MTESSRPSRRGPRALSAETKWEIFVQVTSPRAHPGRRRPPLAGGRVDGDRHPPDGQGGGHGGTGPHARAAKERNWELERARAELGQLTEAVKAQAIELAIVRGKAGWGS